MLSAFVLAGGDAAPLARTLAALVPAAVNGRLGAVAVYAPAPTERVRAIVNDMGCVSFVGDLGAALTAFRTRAVWSLWLKAGMLLPAGWDDEAERFVMAGQTRIGAFRAASPASLLPVLRDRLLRRASTADSALLVPRQIPLTAKSGEILAFAPPLTFDRRLVKA